METFSLVVPVKRLAGAKSRLALGEGLRRTLMRGFALDTVAAALESPLVGLVTVVTDEPGLAGDATALGALVLPDEGRGRLNDTLRAAAARLPRPGPVAAVCADLPCLRSDELTDVLRLASEVGTPCFVADADATGTTLLAAPAAADLDPHFGPGSRASHRAYGALEIELPAASVRRDVDTVADLSAAIELGIGPHTRAVLAPVPH